MKKKLLVSFSGGETSGYMAQWLWKHKRDEYEMIFVFANTGIENEETLIFAHKCAEYFGFPLVYVEANVFYNQRKATSFQLRNHFTASRKGEPFEAIIKKYGIPNAALPHCTRELKTSPINAYAKSLGWKDYYTAIGIREDEIDRMNGKRLENKIIYPLIQKDMRPMTKPKINFWWTQQPFRLELKGYQGNCITCWKKSDKKLFTIAKENEKAFDFMNKMEATYGNYVPTSRLKLIEARGEMPLKNITFFRNNRSAIDIVNQSKDFSGIVIDDSELMDESESCEVHSNCGDT